MFQIKESECTGFDSTWKNEKTIQDSEQQTLEFAVQDQSTSTTNSSSVLVQTDHLRPDESLHDVDMNKLANWLRKIYPAVSRELNDYTIANAIAVTNYMNEKPVPVKLLQTIPSRKNKESYVNCISWNSTGNTFAISCSYKHKDWCHHAGEIKIYTFNRDGNVPENPTKNLVCGDCISALSFHTTNPPILCAGTISGEVLMWNVYHEDSDGLLTSVSGHEDKVTSMSWITTIDSKQSVLLATASLDSYLILWHVNIQNSVLQIKQKYKISRYFLSHSSIKVEPLSKESEKGIVHFDFSVHIPGLFVLGTEGGFILKCSLLGAKNTGYKVNSVLDPYVSSFEGHQGEINTVKFSLHRKELFFTLGSDDEIHMYHIEQMMPVQTIFVKTPLSHLSWIVHEPNLIVGCSLDGTIKIYSLRHGQNIYSTESKSKEPLTVLAVNSKRNGLVLIGDEKGNLHLWSIPWNDVTVGSWGNVN